MKVVNYSQGSDEWLEWRRGGVTASDAAVLLGVSPYKTKWRLWAEKTGYAKEEDLSANPMVRHGKRYEDAARQLYESKHDELLLPVCVESVHASTLRASLDGLDGKDRPIELKCPSETTFNEVKLLGEKSEAYKLYNPQVQYQLLVTGAKDGVLAFWFDDELIEFPIKADAEMQQILQLEAGILWGQVLSRKEPAKDLLRDLYIPQDDESAQWKDLSGQYINYEAEVAELKAKIAKLQEKQKPLLDDMQVLMGDFYHADYAGLMVTRYQVSGRVDYEKALKELAPSSLPEDLDKFRKSASDRYRITVTGRPEPKNIVDEEVIEALNIPTVESFYF